ncbi:MAG TPA: carboxypeptidase-like regulatory domain-containing protein [Candidatus Acidoferrales bacterium]|nr:carboxypeptidase-like regulatory domain-containing protein [Candidatus Acidoferrales bacterium]
MKFRNVCLLLLFAFFASPHFLAAQTPGTGALTGTVKDPSGAVIPNATVTLTSVNTGQARTTMTGADGVYHFNLLPPGNYRVHIESSGFKPVDVPSVAVAVTETAVLDRNLEVGAQAQTVTVEGEVENIQTASSALGTVVNTRSMETLPLSTRNYTNLLAMTAGASAGVSNSTTLGKSATGIAVNGADIGQNTYLQDGVAVNTWSSTNTTQEGTNSGAFPTPNPDTIQEFKIQVSNYDAGYGRNPGANVNVITKSGTNDFHGSAFEFFRNTALNANDYFWNASTNTTPGSKQTLNQNQFGGTFGGPVKKDKLFFFVAYQETSEKNGIAGFGYSILNLPPIPNMPRGSCPLSATTEASCDPTAQAFASTLGGIVCPGNNPGNGQDKVKTTGSVQVACNGSNINPVALRVMQLQLPNGQYAIPGAYTVSGGSSSPNAGSAQYPLASFTDPAKFNDHQGMGNFDYVLSSKHTLSGRYFFEEDPINGNFASNGTRITASNVLPGFPVFEQKTYHDALLRLTSILSNNMVNEARVSYQRVIAVAKTTTNLTNSQFGIGDLTPGVDNFSEITIKGLGGLSFGSNTAFGLNNTSNQFEAADQVSWTHGIHSFRVGAEGQHVINDASSAGSGYMNITFKTFPDFLLGWPACTGAPGPVIIPNTVTCGGVPTNGASASNIQSVGGTTQAFAGYRYMFRLNYINAFVQDDIKLTPRFTLNAGVRWEWDGFPTVANGVTSTFWPTLYNAAPRPGTGCVVNGVPVGAGAAGTGCSLAGFVVPNNYQGNLPAGVTRNSTDYVTQTTPPWHNFAPRLGFAWQPTSSNRFVVRGGIGMFYELINGIQAAYMPLRVMPGAVNVQQSPNASWSVPGVPPAAYPGPFGGVGFTPLWGDPATGATSNIQQNLVPQNLTTPITYEWNLNTQYEFVRNWVLELGYVGSHGIRQEQGGSVINADNWNMAQLITPTNTINGIKCDNSATFCNTSSNANLRAPYLGFSTNSNLFNTNGAYRFDALLATVRKQFSKGLQLQVSYTWSKGLITQGYGINEAPYAILQMGPNPDYHPQRVVINYVWNLPAHLNGWKGRVLNDWTWAGVTTIQDGVPFTVYDGNSGAAFFQGGVAGDTYGPALICPGVNPLTSGPIETRMGGALSANGYLNPNAFAYPGNPNLACQSVPTAPGDNPAAKTPATMFGNTGLGTFISPGQYNWDMSISKLFHIRESKTLEFRSEFFNTFNHPQFSFNPVDDPAFAAQDISASNFGQITVSSVNPRLIQFVLKFLF